VYLNLTLPEFLSSDYYYVFPNDLIYVEPAKAKAFDINSRSVSIVLSAVSVATLLANVIFSIRRN
jgi:polysaccharide export outer membrane protein